MRSDDQTHVVSGEKGLDDVWAETEADPAITWFPTVGILENEKLKFKLWLKHFDM